MLLEVVIIWAAYTIQAHIKPRHFLFCSRNASGVCFYFDFHVVANQQVLYWLMKKLSILFEQTIYVVLLLLALPFLHAFEIAEFGTGKNQHSRTMDREPQKYSTNAGIGFLERKCSAFLILILIQECIADEQSSNRFLNSTKLLEMRIECVFVPSAHTIHILHVSFSF